MSRLCKLRRAAARFECWYYTVHLYVLSFKGQYCPLRRTEHKLLRDSDDLTVRFGTRRSPYLTAQTHWLCRAIADSLLRCEKISLMCQKRVTASFNAVDKRINYNTIGYVFGCRQDRSQRGGGGKAMPPPPPRAALAPPPPWTLNARENILHYSKIIVIFVIC